jgi:hypothetical protein
MLSVRQKTKRMESFLIITSVFLVSSAVRALIGYPIRCPKSDNLDFETKWVTGYPAFSRGLIISGANCMWVQITKEKVSIRTHFPFSIFLVPEFFGLGWEFRKEKLIHCSKTPWGVRVRYRGRFIEREFVVHVGDKDGFIEAVSNA